MSEILDEQGNPTQAPAPKKGAMQTGDVVYFKKAKTSSSRKATEYGFKGHAFGLMLGHVPPFQKDADALTVRKLMGQCGLLTFDDVADFLGDEQAAICVKKFEDKYYGKLIVDPDANAVKEEEPHEPTL